MKFKTAFVRLWGDLVKSVSDEKISEILLENGLGVFS